ncbi:MAG TPA: cytochrome P450 [Acidimicrobiales bacterium]|nr:cytochrome P450 [Acidimicrobiales bacterium]
MLVVLTRPAVLRPVLAVLRRVAPVLRLGRRVVVSRHADVVEILGRDQDFTLSELNGPPIERWSGPFILGMDRGDTYDREAAALRRAVPGDELPRVRALVRANAEALLARSDGRIDVVGEYSRVAATRLVASYFGVPGPDEATMMRWMRAMFDAVFIDFGPRAARAAELTVAEQRPYMERLVADRRAAVGAGEAVPDDLVTRLVREWADDDAVRRNVNGIVVGAVDTTSKAVAHVVDELLRRPAALEGARRAAADGDVDAVRGYAWEALRFLPHGPFLQRRCARPTTLASGRHVAAGTTVMLAVLSAMFDADAFPQPGRFRADRPADRYLHFGAGLHACFGRHINAVQVPELVAALLRLPGLRRAPGRDGRLAYDGPFPHRLVLEFDRS